MVPPIRARGEVDVAVGGETLRLVCSMGALARLSALWDDPPLPAILERLSDQRVPDVLAAAEIFAVDAAAHAAVRAALERRVDDFPVLAAGVVFVLTDAFRAPETAPGKQAPATGNRSGGSRGGNGWASRLVRCICRRRRSGA